MKRIYIVAFILALSQISYAQFPGGWGGKKKTIKGKVTGRLLDSLSKEPIAYAALALKTAKKEIIVNGVISEEDGSFKFEDVETGTYDIIATFIGYNDKKLDTIKTTLKHPDLHLGDIWMSPSLNLLEEVEITAEKALIENKVDKIVFNAENDSSIGGGDATEVLRKVPMLSVDLDGNVSLRGNSNVRILVNGKPSGMFASSPSEALKMFPANQIKKVEVITSPSAKYDAEGSGGIINIITKNENIEGVAGSTSVSVGNRQNRAHLQLNAGKGRFGFSSSGGLFYMLPSDAVSSFYRESNLGGPIVVASNEGQNESSRIGYNASASAFYDFNAYHAINSNFSVRGFGFNSSSNTKGSLIDPVNSFMDDYNKVLDGDNLNSGFDWSTDYTMKFEDKKDQELVVAAQYSRNVQDQSYDLNETHVIDALSRYERVNNDGTNHETTLQVDYVHPFTSGIKLETGIKGILRDIVSDYDYNQLLGNMYVPDPTRSNVFQYDQNVYSGYGSMTFILAKKYSLIAGLRYEKTDLDGNYDSRDVPGIVKNNYDNWLPNFAISRSLKNFRTIKLSYSNRIQRPSLQYINPFNNQQDLYNQTFGNPLLSPEKTHQVELNYNFNVKGISVFASTYYKRTEDVIESTLGVNSEGVSINTFDNVGTRNSIGLNLFTSKSINKFTIRGGGDIFTYDASGTVNGEKLTATDLQYRLFLNGDYKISGSLKMDFFGFFMAPRRTLQGTNPSFSIMGIGIRKEFKNWSIGLRTIEPFRPTKNFDSSLAGADFNQESKFKIDFWSIGLDVRYKFGKVDFKERKSKVKNTDLLNDDGQGQQGGGQNGM